MRGNKLEAIYICLFRLAAHKDSQQTNFPAQQVFVFVLLSNQHFQSWKIYILCGIVKKMFMEMLGNRLPFGRLHQRKSGKCKRINQCDINGHAKFSLSGLVSQITQIKSLGLVN